MRIRARCTLALEFWTQFVFVVFAQQNSKVLILKIDLDPKIATQIAVVQEIQLFKDGSLGGTCPAAFPHVKLTCFSKAVFKCVLITRLHPKA